MNSEEFYSTNILLDVLFQILKAEVNICMWLVITVDMWANNNCPVREEVSHLFLEEERSSVWYLSHFLNDLTFFRLTKYLPIYLNMIVYIKVIYKNHCSVCVCVSVSLSLCVVCLGVHICMCTCSHVPMKKVRSTSQVPLSPSCFLR